MLDTIVGELVGWAETIIESAGYWGIFISMIIESFFVPFPSEIIMPFAGYLVSQGTFSLLLVSLIGAFGSYIGTLPFYFFGSLTSEGIVRKFIRKWGKWIFIPEEDLDKAIDLFTKKGGVIVFVGRMLPGIRSVLSLPAGIAKMEFMKYSLFTLLGSFSWSFLLAILGYFLGESWNLIGGYIKQFEHVILAIVLFVVIYYVYSKVKSNGKKHFSTDKQKSIYKKERISK